MTNCPRMYTGHEAAAFGPGGEGERVAALLAALVEARAITTMMATFFASLRRSVGAGGHFTVF